MKMLFLLLCVGGLVLFATTWDGQRQAVAQVRLQCEDAGFEREICGCHAKKFKERTTLTSFIGAGEFRPLLVSRSEKNQMVAKAGALCLAEQLLK